MALLEIENLSFSYSDQPKKVLNNLTFSVEKGEFLVVCGESGSGKSTLLRLFKRELAPFGQQQGNILYKGLDMRAIDDRESAAKIGFVMQSPDNQIVTDKVWSELAFGLENLGVEPQTIRSRVGEMANYFGIHDWFKRDTSELSGGQKQILNLASVLVMQPEVLILDEPTAQLDPIAATEFINTLYQLNQEMNMTIIIVEHRLEELYSLASSILLLEEGELIIKDTPHNVGHQMMRKIENKNMLQGFPASLRIYDQLKIDVEAPINVKEGIRFLHDNFQGLAQKTTLPAATLLETETVIELAGVWFRYQRQSKDVLANVSLQVNRQEFFCLLGGNGSGKSTLLSVLSGMNKAYEGKIKLFGKKISSYKDQQLYGQKLAILPQNPLTLFIEETVLVDYQSVCQTLGLTESEAQKKIAEVSHLLGIENLLSAHPYDISGGEQQKVALGKLLLLDPELILLDEPTKGIDANAKNHLGKILKQLTVEGRTIFMVTHDTEFAASYATRCALFFDQQVISLNDPVTFFSNNYFYTTPAKKIARELYPQAITTEQVVALCQEERASAHEKI